jgi:hypothetical protein
MTVTIETIELPNYTFVKKFTTDLTTGQDTTSWICPDVESVEYLVIAGGGGYGGYANGAGGGGGEVKQGTLSVIPGELYTITIGCGGAANSNGQNSIFSSISANSGKCSDGSRTGGMSGNGHSGGWNNSSSGDGGGGGDGGAGYGSADTPPCQGGIGSTCSITGTAVYYGGGGAAARNPPASGGLGGGGAMDTSGSSGTGGGSGGSGYSSGMKGGSGIVILSYTLPPTIFARITHEAL